MAIHRSAPGSVALNRCAPKSQFRADVLAGLNCSPKAIPSKYFYDERGSALFDRICELPEYYLTRTELSIMRRYVDEMAEALRPGCLLVEYGSGSSVKTPILLEALRQPAGYVPVDISREHLHSSANALARRFPRLDITPVWADFTEPFELPHSRRGVERTAVYFPGSTIGNFTPKEAVELMKQIAHQVGPGGGLLIGVDVRKPAEIVEPAYNDRAGVTAAFNLNLLVRINRELDGNFDPNSFEHRAFFDEVHGRIEMQLISKKKQVVRIDYVEVPFAPGESIRTEYSYKYCPDHFGKLARQAGFEVRQVWMDDERLFSVQYLTPRRRPALLLRRQTQSARHQETFRPR
jgi:dimethylhistidine N-methyltransferase